LQRRAVRVALKTPLTRLNEGELDAMMALAAGLGVPYRVDPTITPRDDGERSPLAYQASAEAVARLFHGVAGRGELPLAERTSGGVNCGLGRITMAIDPEGNVYPCVQWRHSRLGNVREAPLERMWRTSAVREGAAAVSDAANERLMAAGGALSRFPFCPALAFQQTGDPLTPDPAHVQRAQIADALRAPRA
jgi:MoaA/NifB/PqqE/SkfB family radical SAM enzyme